MADDWPGLRSDPADRWHFGLPEELQLEPDPPRRLFRWWWLGLALVVGVLWWV